MSRAAGPCRTYNDGISTIDRGTRLGPYEVVSRIGAGGMGVVWQARDTRLDRSVAIKVLPPEFAASAQLRLRFEREAKAISSLNHPHICTLFDVGEGYLVMELLEGESLADRLRKGPLPLDQVLRYGMQIAQALDAAHRQGIVHRDLKPGNVMITKSGAKLLDFGLAKGGLFAGPSSGASFIPASEATEHKPLTEEGMILGTFQYMSPEQLEGTEADARTDIFALGALLYEMATGRRAFQGQSRTSLIAAIVSSEPAPISSVAPMAPPALDHIVKRCLEKNPDDRWQSAHDVAGELRWISEAGSQAGTAAPLTIRRKTRERVAWSLAAVFLLAALALAGQAVLRARTPVRPVRSVVLPPEGTRLPLGDDAPGSGVPSPDGSRIVFRAADAEGRTSLYVDDLATGKVQALPDTGGAQYAFWSPDSRWVGFFTQVPLGEMKKIDTRGGPPVRVTSAVNGKGASWNAAGEILFTPEFGSPLFLVPAAGGAAREVTRLDLKLHNSHRHPRFLPDGRRFLFLARSIQTGRENSVMLGSLDGGEPREILQSATNAEYADGHLLFVRGETLMAQRFDPDRGELEGEAHSLAEGVVVFKGACFSTVAAAKEGLLVYHTGRTSELRTLEWRDRKSGALAGTVGEPADYFGFDLSPSGARLGAILRTDGVNDLWSVDLATSTSRRLPSISDDLRPVWSRDEKSLVFSANTKGRYGIYRWTLEGSKSVETVIELQDDLFPIQLVPDGSGLLVFRSDPRATTDSGSGVCLLEPGARELTPLMERARLALVSPQSRWIAWTEPAEGGSDLFVAKYPGLKDRRQLANKTGFASFLWSRTGQELLFADTKNRWFAIEVKGDTFGAPRPVPVSGLFVATSSDGQRILTLAESAAPPTSTLRMIQNWRSALERKDAN